MRTLSSRTCPFYGNMENTEILLFNKKGTRMDTIQNFSSVYMYMYVYI